MRRLLFMAPVAVLVLVLVGFFFGLKRDPSLLPSMMVGKAVPAFSLPPVRPEDRGFATTDLGGEPMLINYYASWCAACRIEHPLLMQLREQGVMLHGIDWKDKPELGYKWISERGDPYVRVGSDESGRAGIDMGVSAVPETFVIDRQGRVRYRHVGAVTREVWETTLQPLMVKLRSES